QDNFPCGAAYRAIRSPRTNSLSDLKKLQFAGSSSSLDSDASGSESSLTDELNNQVISVATPPPVAASAPLTTSEQDLAKRAQRRVIDHKRSELEKKQELEKTRLKKMESEKLQKEKANLLKHRRRAEIYALNAIMKQIQQTKIASFLASQKQLEAKGAGCSSGVEAPLPHSIGV
uniref:Uncharacterized protein n=1 Tax=Globisporangium ultimum (strain ATCC 200006 / CBS 805.95 / DAOM BR144) TaxID=431595 RepID=K3W9G6_GLOUD